jgi:prepilin-type N-terminal cleavage/methylation domain-containing protein
MQDQKGVTLLEVVMAILVISLTVAAMIKALDQTLKGQAQARNRLRASTIAITKLDAMKDYVRQAALGGSFRSVTCCSPMAQDFALTHSAIVENKAFTWRVTGDYVDVTLVSGTVSIVARTYTTKALSLTAAVFWKEQVFFKALSQSVIVTDPSQ